MLADDGAQKRRLANSIAPQHAQDASDSALSDTERSACAAP